MIIEAHVIHTLPVSRNNCNEDGQPKSIFFGDAERDRLSSQAQKAAARAYTRLFELFDASQRAKRTRRFTHLVTQELIAQKMPPEKAELLATRAMAALGMGHKSKRKETDETLDEILIFFSEPELQGFVAAISQFQTEIEALDFDKVEEIPSEQADEALVASNSKGRKTTKETKKQKAKKQFPDHIRQALQAPFATNRSFEVAMYGRHLTNFPQGTVDSQLQVAHAISVHRTRRQLDFFTAIDDYAEPGMPLAGSTMITAPTYYRMAAVNISQLAVELGSNEAAIQAASVVLEAFILTLPTGSKNAHLSYTTPSFVLLQCADKGHGISLAPAFEKAIVPQPNCSMSEAAVVCLEAYVQQSEQMFPRLQRNKKVYLSQDNLSFKGATKMVSLPKAIAQVTKGFVAS
jgi:CRISPR system Cascade subunit CasC